MQEKNINMYIYAIASYFLHPCTPKLPSTNRGVQLHVFVLFQALLFNVEFYAVGSTTSFRAISGIIQS